MGLNQSLLYKKQIKCSDCGSLATKGSIQNGRPYCFRHDPDWDPKEHTSRYRKKKQKEREEREKTAVTRFEQTVMGGKRKAVMPAPNLELYEMAVLDEDCVELREDIATWEARIQELLAALRDDPRNSASFAGKLTKRLRNLVIQARKTGNMGAQELLELESIADFVDGASSAREAWIEVAKATDLKRKLVETETKRMKDIGWTPEYVHAVLTEASLIIKGLVDAATAASFMEALLRSPILNNGTVAVLPKLPSVSDPDAALVALGHIKAFSVDTGSSVDAEFEDIMDITGVEKEEI